MVTNSLDPLTDEDLKEIGKDNRWDDLKNGKPFQKEDINDTKIYLEEKLKELNEKLEKEDSDTETIVPDESTPIGSGPNSPLPETSSNISSDNYSTNSYFILYTILKFNNYFFL